MVKTSPSNAGGACSIPGRGAKIPHASRPKNQNVKQRQYCNKFNKDFKNRRHQKSLKKKKRSKLIHRYRELVVIVGRGRGEKARYGQGIKRYKLLCIK